jgi:hypothetical protein
MQRSGMAAKSSPAGKTDGVRRWRLAVLALAGFAVMQGVAQTVQAQEPWRHYRGWQPERWHGGRWHHGWHGGRLGWWWIAPGIGWTFYTAPVYPYPPLPVPAALPAGPPPAATWYWCPHPRGYYPYVQRCFAPWRPVPAG